MASSYTGLGTELMVTGENAGTWGTNTNTNLQIIEQFSSGYTEQSLAGGAQTTTLSVSDGSTGATLAHRIIKFTGSITGDQIVTIPLDVQTFYIILNGTTDGSGTPTVQFKYVSGTGGSVTWAAEDKGTKIIYATANDATNPDIIDATSAFVTATSTTTLSNKTLTAPKFADGGFIADANGAESLVFGTTSSAVNEVKITNAATGTAGPIIASQGETNSNLQLRPAGSGVITVGTAAANATITSKGAYDLILSTNEGSSSSNITITDAANGDVTVTPNGSGIFHIAGNSTQAGTLKLTEDTDDGSNFVAMKAPNVSTSYTMTLPTAVAAGNDYILKSTTGGVLSWGEAAGGGTSWQAVVTGATQTAVAGEGYFINTTSNACTLTLPAGTISDEVSVIDYAGTFDTNNLTVEADGSEKIHGSTDDLTVATERAGFTLVYSDSTQGWLLKDK
jgi:hypothetical protein